MRSYFLPHSILFLSPGLLLCMACSAASDGSFIPSGEGASQKDTAVVANVPRQVLVTDVSTEGELCPSQSFNTTRIVDGLSVASFLADSMVVVGPDATGHCTLTIGIEVPEGWNFTGPEMQFRGFVGGSGTGHLRTRYTFGDGVVTFESAFAEGEYGDFTYAERLWNGKTLWSPCSNGRVELIVDIEMRNEAVDAEQLFTLDTIDMTFHDLGGLRFKRCGDTQAVPLRKAKAAEECAGVGGIECVDGLACDFSNNLEWRTGVCEDPDGDNEPGVDGSQCGGVARKTCQDGLVCRTPGEGLLGECVDPSALRPNLECGDGLGTCGYGASCKKRLDDPNSPGLCLLPAGEGGVCIGVYDAECKEGLICDTEDPTAHTGYRTDGAGYVVGTCRLSTD